MTIVTGELSVPTAEEIRNLVRRAYDAGCAQGREEARHELQGLAGSLNGARIEAGEPGVKLATTNGVHKRGFADDVKRLRRDLAELKEMVRLGAGVPGDEQRIEMIKDLLARWQKIAPVIIIDAVENHFQTWH
jgi:hypothetical protein